MIPCLKYATPPHQMARYDHDSLKALSPGVEMLSPLRTLLDARALSFHFIQPLYHLEFVTVSVMFWPYP